MTEEALSAEGVTGVFESLAGTAERPGRREHSSTADRTIVVGAAIIRTGHDGTRSVLCARRSAPPRLAGKWEFPGGKVEPGETDGEAIVRECYEELGVEVVAGSQIGGDQPVDERLVLRVYLAELLPGQPEPLPLVDHDVLTWVPSDGLLALDWLPADVPIVTEMTATALIV